MQYYKSILVYGFAIFAMFFGSGNLVFPLQIGFSAGSHWLAGFSGLLITGIFLPLLGLFVIKLYQGNYHKFFGEAGKVAGIFLPLMMLSLLGSFGVVPRCITVAFGSIHFLYPSITLTSFSLLFCVITYLFCMNDKVMVNILGKWMSPILLLILIVLICLAIIKAPEMPIGIASAHSFSEGFYVGYQTMDLFAAFFFSALIFQQIQQDLPTADVKETFIFAVKTSLIGASLLGLIYAGLVYLGSQYGYLISKVSPELILPTIAAFAIGKQATLFMAIIMFFSCLTTAVALNNLFARYLCYLFKLKDKQFYLILLVTTSTAFIVSLLDFNGIAKYLAPILQLTYPAIITLTLLCIFLRGWKLTKITIFYLTTLLVGSISYAFG